jgi:hypothetical protein
MQEDSTTALNERQLTYLDIITRLYMQQRTMYENKSHRCDDHIVSIHQPHVRPIVGGKVTAAK